MAIPSIIALRPISFASAAVAGELCSTLLAAAGAASAFLECCHAWAPPPRSAACGMAAAALRPCSYRPCLRPRSDCDESRPVIVRQCCSAYLVRFGGGGGGTVFEISGGIESPTGTGGGDSGGLRGTSTGRFAGGDFGGVRPVLLSFIRGLPSGPMGSRTASTSFSSEAGEPCSTPLKPAIFASRLYSQVSLCWPWSVAAPSPATA